ncbi:MAG: polyhydroxyalkanoic acid system family protein [Planctomycetota bacterium]|nr:polyhydroxyalkanoic acid system family protein [Planctomycetaceae bacterium]MDQ3333215.1 polyhydroxyalkanoic acid system family protein [Planctomycetota bacterium]
MPLVNVSVKHNTTFEDAKVRLEGAVADVQGRFASVVRNIEWSPDRTAVKLTGPGVIVDLKVDAEHVHATGDVPLLNLLGKGIGKRISEGLKGALQRHFPKGIPEKK